MRKYQNVRIFKWNKKENQTVQHEQKRAEKLRTIISIAFISFSAVVSPLILLYLCFTRFNWNSRFVDFVHANAMGRGGKSKRICMVRCAEEVLVPFKPFLAVTFANESWMRATYEYYWLNYLRFTEKIHKNYVPFLSAKKSCRFHRRTEQNIARIFLRERIFFSWYFLSKGNMNCINETSFCFWKWHDFRSFSYFHSMNKDGIDKFSRISKEILVNIVSQHRDTNQLIIIIECRKFMQQNWLDERQTHEWNEQNV